MRREDDFTSTVDAAAAFERGRGECLQGWDGDRPTLAECQRDEAGPTWPESPEEQVDYVDWQYEVANGDTVLGFRDWIVNREEMEGGE